MPSLKFVSRYKISTFYNLLGYLGTFHLSLRTIFMAERDLLGNANHRYIHAYIQSSVREDPRS